MLEALTAAPTFGADPTSLATYPGPERRRAPGAWRWLAAMLDEIDYGMLLLAPRQQVAHANHVARSELDEAHPLQLVGNDLRARRAQDVAPLCDAIAGAVHKGLRRLLTLDPDGQRVSVAVVPLGAGDDGATLLMFGRRSVGGDLSVQSFALAHRLTPAETAVLHGLCGGRSPLEIAHAQCVAISTVRTQISSIRAKTGADSIRDLVQQVATLPPLVSALRQSRCARPVGLPQPAEA